MFRSTPESIARLLISTGWLILLFYIPSGWLHHTIGANVYLRDILLALHLFASLVWLQKNGQLQSLLSKAWLLGLVPLFLLPALFNSETRVEMGGYIKWSLIWLDCIIIGRLTAQFFSWSNASKTLAILTAALLLTDWGTGYYEYSNNTLVIPMKGQLSPLGMEMGRDTSIKNKIRFKGLQRDVFSYANLMGMAVVGGVCVLVCVEGVGVRIAAGAWIVLFSFMLYNCGGRSAFLGVGAAGMLGAGLLFSPEVLRKHFSKIALGWLVIGLFMSIVGIGDFTQWFTQNFMKGTHIGDYRSAYDRDVNWQGVRHAIAGVPIVLFTGSPLGSLIDSKVATIYHWADNNYLWLLYHGSFISLAGLILYFRNALARPISSSRLWSKDCLLLFLLYVMGEAMARESLAFLGCVPLFLACGYVNGIRLTNTSPVRSTETIHTGKLASLAVSRSHESATPRSSSKPRRKRSDADALAERIRRAHKDTPPES